MNIIENFIWMNMVKFHLKKKTTKKYSASKERGGEKIFQYFNKEIKFSKKYKILDHGAAQALLYYPGKKRVGIHLVLNHILSL